MKHTLQVTLILVLLFIVAQVVGLLVTNNYLIDGVLPYDIERPEVEESTSYIPIIIAILIATGLALLIMKFKAFRLWKVWFFIGLLFTLLISFGAFVAQNVALVLALAFTIWKLFYPNVYIHNFTELFLYGGLAGLFVPILNVFSITILLIAISVYDMIAVWKTKHMVSLAKFQTKSKLFAGLMVPYKKGKQTAILGGGDIGFPLLFAGVILRFSGWLDALIVVGFAALALFGLFIYSKKDQFYPAMPFISAGVFLGYFVGLLV
tara:strand:+ start:5675 stop:6466 length:792 start_codon:yes stop_codon:yes gene_type:complete